MMGLSTKQVSSTNEGLDWSQSSLILQPPPPILHPTKPAPPPPDPTGGRRRNQMKQQEQSQSQQPEPLKCPRCESSNTKFCYYNNYNRSQPRHFCKACKRHWTRGGTLRNVPVGGGRKNKRPSSHKPSGNGKIVSKKPKQSTSGGGRASPSNDAVSRGAIANDRIHHPSLPSLLKLPSPMGPPAESESLAAANFDEEDGGGGIGFVFTQGLSFPNYSASSSSSASVSTSAAAAAAITFDGQFLGLPYGGGGGYNPATWQVPSTISGECGNVNEMAAATTTGTGGGYWNWDVDDMDNLVSAADLNIPWDIDSEIKP